ncbi:MAG: hypothetical protein A3C93_00785 [Candidatus Lloydbacteria bacterium RIFCSPHIGHO2_02_FULL_54_17]|uniref:Uncharacterized protein n=1 Tax=Candidatus Lloydbacteria bacterium RIFCSPHIGHO2_02_FULL_54_17 TaxID=1798664 RepID=A0A1G2DEV7_9BACT|nr:MAG: hypothetical protein A2762_06225 [Candidatus Lloydbacteria bacterium RIFCSPHIGHO2_01_FULL_54_11]OGZ12175.1 MAG: hypothetical protein A3C93_00785 [Candidatus Lloydbacteria bacterium RIFCSPHIGHO2_02_FULL_54_17]OGZ12966.1 MAG: hypothetical protein A2948_01230 [Candidatus Lloydbacteria bacterium RIFCSPLOWO2_01_FULL_54_18]
MVEQEARVWVSLPDKIVLIYHTWKNKIPAGIQVLHACGGSSGAPVSQTPPEGDVGVVRNARFSFDTFTGTCLIDTVIVSEGVNGYCKVYVNCSVRATGREKNFWWENSAYHPFLRELFSQTYKNVKMKSENGKTSVRFSDKRAKGPVESQIVFLREKERQGVAA